LINNLLEKEAKTLDSVDPKIEQYGDALPTEIIMLEKMRQFLIPKSRPGKGFGWKNWVAYILFGAIIIVFALFGMDQRQGGGQSAGGVAAVVNDSTISLADFRARVESIEQNARMRFDQFPEAQRRALSQELRRRALDELIMGELVYQAANDKGVIVADGEVREYIRQIPILQENGRFMSERYRAFLMQMNLSPVDFERQVRKQIVTQKLQELFLGAATPSREELRRNRLLANQKVNVRFAEIREQDLENLLTGADVQAYLAGQNAEVEKYYNDNQLEFSTPEKIKARHILIRIDDRRPEAEAQKMAAELREKATPQNFAQLAAKNSDDPGSKVKGGDLGEFERGRMVPAFEEAAFALKPGEISQPVKSDFGYHIIFVEGKSEARVQPLEQAQSSIARKLLVRGKGAESLASLRQVAEAGKKKELDTQLSRAGVKWQESGEFDLSSTTVPKLGESPALMGALIKQGSKSGLIPQVIPHREGYLVAEVMSWKEASDKNPDVDGLERMVAYRKADELIQNWSKEVEAKASIQRNPRLVQQ